MKFMPQIVRTADTDGAGGSSFPERPDHVSEDEWDGLSTAEREALNETDEGEGAHQILGDGDELDDDGGTELTDEEIAALEGEVPEGAETPAVETEIPTPENIATAETITDTAIPTDEELLSYRPTVSDSELKFVEDIPTEIQTKLDALDKKIDDAEALFDEGEMTRADLNKLNREVSRERETVNREIMRYQIQQRDNQREEVVWLKEQSKFIAARPDFTEYESDGKTFTVRAEALYGAFNQQVKRLNANPANATKSGMQILVEADRAVRQAFGIPLPSKKVTPVVPPTTKVSDKKPPASNRPPAKTLTNVPVAEGETTGNPLGAISRLSGEKFEKALERMTPAQREAMLEKV